MAPVFPEALRKFTKRELFLLLIIFAVLLALWLGHRWLRQPQGGQVTVYVDGDVYGVYNLNEERKVLIDTGGAVTNTLVIRGGKADMISADCPDQICVNMHPVSVEGETIVCLPNKVVVEVTDSDAEAEADVVQ